MVRWGGGAGSVSELRLRVSGWRCGKKIHWGCGVTPSVEAEGERTWCAEGAAVIYRLAPGSRGRIFPCFQGLEDRCSWGIQAQAVVTKSVRQWCGGLSVLQGKGVASGRLGVGTDVQGMG